LSDVSEQIHIRSVYLQGIEEEEWSAIAAPVYARGFIRVYARFLGLDGEAAVERFNAFHGRAPAAAPVALEAQAVRTRLRRGRPSPWLWLTAVAAAVLVGFVGYNLFQLPGERASRAEVGVASPTAPGVTLSSRPKHAAKQAPAAAGETLEVRLTEKSWLSVSVDGNRELIGTFPAGTRKAFHGRLADVRAGNAGAVELRVNGKELGAMGPAGNVVERSITLAEE